MKKNWVFYLCLLGISLMLMFVFKCWARAGEVNMDIIATIESGNNPNAISYAGAKYGRGLYQVSEIVLLEYNEIEVKNWSKKTHIYAPLWSEHLFDPFINKIVANWYMNKRIPQMLEYYHLKDTIDARLACYNAGIGVYLKYMQGKRKLPSETINYLRKYHRLEEK